MDPVNKILRHPSPWVKPGRELRELKKVTHKGYSVDVDAADPEGVNWSISKVSNPNGGSYEMGWSPNVSVAVKEGKKEIDKNHKLWNTYR